MTTEDNDVLGPLRVAAIAAKESVLALTALKGSVAAGTFAAMPFEEVLKDAVLFEEATQACVDFLCANGFICIRG